MSRFFLAGASGVGLVADRALDLRAGALTESGSAEAASIEPKDLTASARWVPVIDGAAGEEDR